MTFFDQSWQNDPSKLKIISTNRNLSIFQLYNNFFLFTVLACAVIGLCGWCVWRFFRKRRPKDKKKNKDEKVMSLYSEKQG
jgi:nitrate reductase NapE component